MLSNMLWKNIHTQSLSVLNFVYTVVFDAETTVENAKLVISDSRVTRFADSLHSPHNQGARGRLGSFPDENFFVRYKIENIFNMAIKVFGIGRGRCPGGSA